MRVLTAVHESSAGPGVFGEVAAERGVELVEWAPAAGPPLDQPDGFAGAVVLGGEVNPDQESEHPWLRDEKQLIRDLLARRVPVLGVCLGAELLAEAAGGGWARDAAPHVGWAESRLTRAGRDDPVLGALPERFHCFQWHGYSCRPPASAETLALDGSAIDAFRVGEAWGIQFHAEVTPEIVAGWLDELEHHADAAAAGFGVARGRRETARLIPASGEVGRAAFGAFLDRVESR